MQDLSSPVKDQIRAPAVEAQSLYLWTTREVPRVILFFFFSQESFLNHNGKEKINLKKREKESFKIDTMPTDLASKESEGVRRQAGEGAGPAGEPV